MKPRANVRLILLFPVGSSYFLDDLRYLRTPNSVPMYMKKKSFLLGVLLLLFPEAKAQDLMPDSVLNRLCDCDLLFQVAKRGNAITDVTQGAANLPIEHVGVYVCLDGRPLVLEAIPERGVCITPLDSFLCRQVSADGRPLVVVGRVTGDIDRKCSLERARSFLGCRYDSLFLPDNRDVYCSELVQKSFVHADGTPVFTPIPMTFRDAEGNIPEYWLRFYARHGRSVPEGEPGSNPGDLSRRPNVQMVWNLMNAGCP